MIEVHVYKYRGERTRKDTWVGKLVVEGAYLNRARNADKLRADLTREAQLLIERMVQGIIEEKEVALEQGA